MTILLEMLRFDLKPCCKETYQTGGCRMLKPPWPGRPEISKLKAFLWDDSLDSAIRKELKFS
jgi:hypothetical protein